jgi:hypothetical protein
MISNNSATSIFGIYLPTLTQVILSRIPENESGMTLMVETVTAPWEETMPRVRRTM